MQLAQWYETGDRFQWRGQEVFYQEAGEGEVVFLLHGFLMPGWSFKEIWTPLSKRYRVIAPDFVGFGFSSKPVTYPYSFDERVEMIYDLAALLQVKQMNILGSSFSVSVAQELIMRCRDGRSPIDIQSVALLNGAIYPSVTKDPFRQRIIAHPLLKWVTWFYGKRTFSNVMSRRVGKYAKFPVQLLDEIWDMHLYNKGMKVVLSINKYLDERNAKSSKWNEALHNTEIPVQLIWGIASVDQISGLSVAHEYRRLKGDQYVVMIKDIGHFPHIECPELVVDYYTSFLDGINGKMLEVHSKKATS